MSTPLVKKLNQRPKEDAGAVKRIKLTADQEKAQIWGRGKNKAIDDDEAELDRLMEGDGAEPGQDKKKDKKKDVTFSKGKKRDKHADLPEHLRPYTLYCPVDATTTRNEIRALFSSYNPHNIRICKATRSNLREPVWYALVTLPNKAMGLHAIMTFEGSNQRKTLGFLDPFSVTPHRSRSANRTMRHQEMKKRLRE